MNFTYAQIGWKWKLCVNVYAAVEVRFNKKKERVCDEDLKGVALFIRSVHQS